MKKIKHPLLRKSKPSSWQYWCPRCEKFEPYKKYMKHRKIIETIAGKIIEHLPKKDINKKIDELVKDVVDAWTPDYT